MNKNTTGIELLNYYEATGLSIEELAEELGVTYHTISSRIYRARRNREGRKPDKSGLFEVEFGSPLELRGDCIVIGDVQIPTTDYDFAQLPAQIALKHLPKPRRLIIAGDLLNLDCMSKYPKTIPPPTWRQERLAGERLLTEWLEVFDEIVVVMGNHERRVAAFTNGVLDDDDIFAMVTKDPRIKISFWGWCTVEVATGTWRITHQKNYSVNQLTVADQLALKYDQHIISHHEHHLAVGWDRYKRHVIVNNGGLFDTEKMAYVILDDSKSSGMAKGFTMLKRGYPYVFGEEPFTDWWSILD